MKSKRAVIFVSAVLLAAAAVILGIIFIPPKETVIKETMRFYNLEVISEDCPDDRLIGELAERYTDVEVDLRIIRGLGSNEVTGTLKFGSDTYYPSLEISADYTGLSLYLIKSGSGGGTPIHPGNQIHFSDDFKHIHISLDEGDSAGYWLNEETVGEYRRGREKLDY